MNDAPRPAKRRPSLDAGDSKQCAKIMCKVPKCSFGAKNELSLHRHTLLKHKVRRCPLCQLKATLSQLREHFRAAHPQKTKYHCVQCDYVDITRDGMVNHRWAKHRTAGKTWTSTGSRSRSHPKTLSAHADAPPDDANPGEDVPEERTRQRRPPRDRPPDRYGSAVEVDRDTLVFVLETLRPSPSAAVQELILRQSGRWREEERVDGDLADGGASSAAAAGDGPDNSASVSDRGDAPVLVPPEVPMSDPDDVPVCGPGHVAVPDPDDVPVLKPEHASDGECHDTMAGTAEVVDTAVDPGPDTGDPGAAAAGDPSGSEDRPKYKWYPGRRWILHRIPEEERYVQNIERHQGLRSQLCVATQHSFCSEDPAQLLDAYSAIALATPFLPRIVWELGLSIAVTSDDTELMWAVTKHFIRNSALDREGVILAAASAALAAGYRTEALKLADGINFARRKRDVRASGGLVRVLRQFATILLRDKRVAVGAQAQLLQEKLETVLEDPTQRPALLPLLSSVKHVVATSTKEKEPSGNLSRSILGRSSLFEAGAA